MLGQIDRLKGYSLTPDFWKVITEQIVFTLDDKRMTELIFRLVKGTRINGQEVSKPELFDVTFQGNLGFLFNVIKFILENNFSSFIRGSGIGMILSKIANNTVTPHDMEKLNDALQG
jgi:hypothetical protein